LKRITPLTGELDLFIQKKQAKASCREGTPDGIKNAFHLLSSTSQCPTAPAKALQKLSAKLIPLQHLLQILHLSHQMTGCSFNMAKLWKLPAIYIIENNQYAMGTSLARASATVKLADRGAAHGIPGEQVDGMDVRAVKAAGEKAVKWCREGNGPIILEMLTYRYRGHSMPDPAKYRSKEEVDKIRTEHDPIDQVRSRLIAKKTATEDSLKKIDQEVRAIVNEAAEFATHDAEPDASGLYTDVSA